MFQNWQKIAYQTSLNQSIFMNFDRFDDVWYAVFYQFWNKTFIYFPQGYWQQNIWFYRDSKSTPKKHFFIRHTLEKNKWKFCFKIDKKLHTKHHYRICQVTWPPPRTQKKRFRRVYEVWVRGGPKTFFLPKVQRTQLIELNFRASLCTSAIPR